MESRTITLQERCERLDCYNPAAIGKTFAMVKTMKDCLAIQDSGEPVLMAITRQGKAESVKITAMIALNIAAVDRFLHLKNPLNEDEIDFIAEQIVDEFGCALTMADIYIVLRNAKAGVYGKFYERLSAPDVLNWFREYYDNRLDAAYEYNLTKDKQQYSGNGNGDDVLRGLGYTLDKDGRIVRDEDGHNVINKEQVEKNEAARKAQEQNDPLRTDEEYRKFKAAYYGNKKRYMESLKKEKKNDTKRKKSNS